MCGKAFFTPVNRVGQSIRGGLLRAGQRAELRLLGISLVGWAGFALLLQVGAILGLEAKLFDSLQKWRRDWQGARVHADLALVAVDDYSVDPAASPLADVWGRGGWLTRDLWVQQMQFHRDFFRPRVLAYDILFLPAQNRNQAPEASALSRLLTMAPFAERRRQIERLELEGNDEMENQILGMADERLESQEAPYPVFAFYFPTGRQGSWDGRDRRAEVEERLRALALPEGVVQAGSKAPVHRAALLPVDGILHGPCGLGAINVIPDAGGVVRWVPLVDVWEDASGGLHYLPSFSLVVYLRARGIEPSDIRPLGQGLPGMRVEPGRRLVMETEEGRWEVPIDAQMRLFLNSTFRFLDVPTNLSYVRVNQSGLVLTAQALGQPVAPEALDSAREAGQMLRDRVVFIAQAFTGSGDIGNFPLEESTPNVMAFMTAVDNLLRRDFLHPPKVSWTLGFGALVALLLAVAYHRFSPTTATLLGVAGLAVYPPAAYGLLLAGRGVHVLTPMLLIVVLLAAHSFHQFRLASRRRDEIRRLFSSMVSPRVLELMEADPSAVSLAGRRMEATMFFSDVAGFTSISEKLSPQELSALLNRYLTPMSEIIIAYDGYVDKYEGDAIMAVWGVPYPDAGHAAKACRAARDQLLALRGLAAEIHAEFGVEIDIRIGINTGTVSAGNMGSARKFQYTVIGDPVNLAARLEPINKDYGTRCILGPLTRTAVADAPDLVLRRLDRIVVKGKTEPVEIYELCECASRAPWIDSYEEGLNHLWARRWDEAEAAFLRAEAERGGDAASALQRERLAAYRADPPEPDWNGAWVRASKD